ncbi:MAG: glycosyltransferase family 10 domain-containing protein [Limisphaerales bacterium]
MKVRLDFCDFWPGFQKTSNFFYNLLRERFDVQICDQPDFLIYADPGQHVHRLHNCVKIYFSVESFQPDFRECDYAFTCRYLDDPRHMRLPYYVLTTNALKLLKSEEEIAGIMRAKTKFCSFVVSNAKRRKTQKRVEFFHRLSQYKQVDSGGGAWNNIGRSIPAGQPHKLEFLHPYKFNIAFENGSTAGYTTEKLTEAMWARCLPIYWGNPRIGKEFNTRSFLNYFDFPTEEALIEKIIELDQDDAKYMEYLRQPYFHNNQPNEFFGHERLLDHFEKIFAAPITPVSRRRYWNQIGRWIPVLKNKPR